MQCNGIHVLDAFDASIGALPSTAQRLWAWAYLTCDVAAAEIARTHPGEQTSDAVFVYGAMLDALTELETFGVPASFALAPLDLTHHQAQCLLPRFLLRVINEADCERSPGLMLIATQIRREASDCERLLRECELVAVATIADAKCHSLSHCGDPTLLPTVHDKPEKPSTLGPLRRTDHVRGGEKPWTRPAPRCGTTPTFSISFAWVSRRPTNAWRAPTFLHRPLGSSGTGATSPTTSSSGPGSKPAVARGSDAAPNRQAGSDHHGS